MSGDGGFVTFLETAAQLLDLAADQFNQRENAAAAKTLERVVLLCETNPSFAAHRGFQIASIHDVVGGCIRNALHRRVDVGAHLSALLRRIEALGQAGLH